MPPTARIEQSGTHRVSNWALTTDRASNFITSNLCKVMLIHWALLSFFFWKIENWTLLNYLLFLWTFFHQLKGWKSPIWKIFLCISYPWCSPLYQHLGHQSLTSLVQSNQSTFLLGPFFLGFELSDFFVFFLPVLAQVNTYTLTQHIQSKSLSSTLQLGLDS